MQWETNSVFSRVSVLLLDLTLLARISSMCSIEAFNLSSSLLSARSRSRSLSSLRFSAACAFSCHSILESSKTEISALLGTGYSLGGLYSLGAYDASISWLLFTSCSRSPLDAWADTEFRFCVCGGCTRLPVLCVCSDTFSASLEVWGGSSHDPILTSSWSSGESYLKVRNKRIASK